MEHPMSPRRDPHRRRDPGPDGPSLRPRNRILAALPRAELARLASSFTRVALAPREICFDVDQPIEHVYFPESCVASVVGIMSDGSAVETATVGPEGMVGLPVFLGIDRTSTQAFCQVPGEALRMKAGVFRREVRRGGQLPVFLNRYTLALIFQTAQSAACNRLHAVRQRCARWLLQTRDCVGSDAFPFTHQFLSQMLGVRRTTVTDIVGKFQREGLIENRYGRVVIRDRRGLEDAACECYGIIRREIDRLLAGRAPPRPRRKARVSKGGKSLARDGVPRRGTGRRGGGASH
jgi:CRP-like cAMP-binding protein